MKREKHFSAYFHSFLSLSLLLLQGQIETDNDVSGSLCIKQPWPGMTRSIYGDHERFRDTYFKPFPGRQTYVVYK